MIPAVLAVLAFATSASPKRGFSGYLGDYFTCDDASALGLGDSWHYTWGVNPSQRSKCAPSAAAEFVPMIIGVWQAHKINDTHPGWNDTWAAANVKYLLGYNEPDFGNGHNHPHMTTPANAAVDWQSVQKIARQFSPHLTLWLDEFLGNCSDVVEWCDPSTIKYIAMHDYEGNVTKLRRRIEGAAKRYQRKVWLTEFAVLGAWGSPVPRAQQDAFMREALPYLDASDDVHRYAWFTARNEPNQMNGGSNLLPSDSSSTKPTSTGRLYAMSVEEESVV